MAETSRLMGWQSNTQEPKRLNRYELLLDDDLRLACKSVSMPTISVQQVEINRMHNKYKVSGSQVTYGDVTLIFYDFVDNKVQMVKKPFPGSFTRRITGPVSHERI